MTYLYHGTTADRIPLIARFGLRPRGFDRFDPTPSRANYRRPGLFVSHSESDAVGWALDRAAIARRSRLATKGYTGIFSLRFDSRLIRRGIIRDEEAKGDAWIIFDSISPQFIEARQWKVLSPSTWPKVLTENYNGSKWRPISYYRDRVL